MTTFAKTAFAALMLAFPAAELAAMDVFEAPIKTHPSQGDIAIVQDATARLGVYEEGVFANFETAGLTPGNVHTLWFVVINDPAACEGENCTAKDVLKRTEIVNADAGYAGGVIVGADGTASFNWHQPEGLLSGGWFGNGMVNSEAAEIHLVVNDHGPVIDGRVDAMLASYRDGCTEVSIPAPMPAAARAQGEPGPNTCRLVQFTVFKPAIPES